MIIPIENKHVKEIADLHCKYINSLLKEFGRHVCETFYQNAITVKYNFGYVYIKDSKVLGFVLATTNNSYIFKKSLKIYLLMLTLPLFFFSLKKRG